LVKEEIFELIITAVNICVQRILQRTWGTGCT